MTPFAAIARRTVAQTIRTGKSAPLATLIRSRYSSRAFQTSTVRTTPSAAAALLPASNPAAENIPEGVDLPAVKSDDSKVSIRWQDGRVSKFHNRYLFDHCRCEKCFHAATKQRLKQLSDIPSDIHAGTVQPSPTGMTIAWSTPDSHTSYFPWSFLQSASYDPPLVEAKKSEDKILWNSSISKSPPIVEYSSLVPSANVSDEQAERGVLRWLTKVHEFGFCFVSGVPVTPEDTEALIRRIGNIRETHYGGFWDFTADLKHGDMAYTNEPLPAHTDNTYFTDPSGLQIFHLLSHPPPGKGGSSLLVDAFYAASILEALHPKAYSTLSHLAVPSHASGSEGTLLRPLAQPVFKHDAITGELVQVKWNNEDRGVLGKGWRADDVEAWYDAAAKWEEAVKSADAEYWVQLNPGTMVVIDNWRVMHGRSTFTGQRRMCGAYVGHDDWHSRLETLKRKFADKPKDEAARKEYETWSVGW